jgi:translocation and assembly module TamB
MMRRLFHSSWIALLALLLLVGALIYYAGWTEAGLRQLVSLASRRIGPVTLQINGARGTLHGGLHIDSFTLDHRRVHISAANIEGRVALLPLLWQSIKVRSAHIDTVQIRVLPYSDPGGAPWKPHFLIGLLTLQADQAAIGHVELLTTSGRSFSFDQLRANAGLDVMDIHIYDGSMLYSGFVVQSKGLLHAANPLQMAGTMRITLSAAGQPDWLANAQLDGDLDKLSIGGNLLTPFSASFHGEARALTGDWHWQGESQLRRLDLRAWNAGGALGVISGTLQLQGNRNGFAARGALTPPGLASGPLAVDFAGNYAERVLSVSHVNFAHHASGAQLSAAGSVGIVDGGPRLDLHGQWSSFRWPLNDAAAHFASAMGEYSLAGLWPYALQASGQLRVRELPSMPFTAQGRLRHDGIDIAAATLLAYGGQAALHGEANWTPAENWSLAGSMAHMDVAALRPAIRGHVSFALQARGENFGAAATLQAKLSELSGNIRGQRASGHAGIALGNDEWLLQQVRLQLGATRLDLDGRIGEHIDLQFVVDAADLGLLHDGAQGTLRAQGRLRSDAVQPLLQATLHGAGIHWDATRLQALEARIDFDPQGSGRADATIQLDQLQVAQRRFETLRLETAGTMAAHRFDFTMRAPALTVQAGGNASFSNGRWRAQLTRVDTSDSGDIHLTLAEPANLMVAVSGEEFSLQRLCLTDLQARLCADGEHLAGNSHINVSATSVPLRTLTAGLTTDTDFEGLLSLEGHAEAVGANPWSGAFAATLADAALKHHLVGGRVESFSLGNGSVRAELKAAGLHTQVALDAGAQGSINGQLDGRNNGGSWGSWPIAGELHLQTQALGFIDSYVAQVDRVSGRLKADLTLGGQLAAPTPSGELKVSDGQVDAYQINLALREVTLDARLHDSTLELDGSASAGAEGHARVNGSLAWRGALPYGQLHLSGENLRVVNIPEARVQVSPDVNMKFTGHRIDITGVVALPYARLARPDQLTNAVRASGDEIIVHAQQAPRAPGFTVFSDLTLKLGERVTIDTLGLAGRLSGSLRTVTDESGFDRGTGELQVEEGKYTAYGRKLDIERGRLLFSNGPLSDPAIDLRAIKKFPDITAGVNVRGTLRNPRMTFFSDPAVAQAQIVSLLLAGGSLESVQNTSDPASRNSSARANLLLQGSALLFQQFGGKVGLDDVSVESNLNNDTSLVLGRYLSPRLYISYGIGLAEQINTIKMRYTIGDHWTIKTEAGTARSADLVYTIER